MTRHFVTVIAATALIALGGCDGRKRSGNPAGGGKVTIDSQAPRPPLVTFEKIIPGFKGWFAQDKTTIDPPQPVRRRLPAAILTQRVEPGVGAVHQVGPARAVIERSELARRARP